jgi:hypothetical protein
MNFANNRNLQLIALLFLIVAIKLFIDHRRQGYKGAYNPAGSYENVTSVKHDMTKTFWVDLFVMMVMGLGSGQAFYDSDNVLGSWIGRTLVAVAGYFTYHEMVQPYVVNRMPVW